jgi:hypothetical protein
MSAMPWDDEECDDGPWIECWNCLGECLVDHDCGEDCCCCADPQPNVLCDICDGAGGWERVTESTSGAKP